MFTAVEWLLASWPGCKTHPPCLIGTFSITVVLINRGDDISSYQGSQIRMNAMATDKTRISTVSRNYHQTIWGRSEVAALVRSWTEVKSTMGRVNYAALCTFVTASIYLAIWGHISYFQLPSPIPNISPRSRSSFKFFCFHSLESRLVADAIDLLFRSSLIHFAHGVALQSCDRIP